jgi:hypothetical protein
MGSRSPTKSKGFLSGRKLGLGGRLERTRASTGQLEGQFQRFRGERTSFRLFETERKRQRNSLRSRSKGVLDFGAIRDKLRKVSPRKSRCSLRNLEAVRKEFRTMDPESYRGGRELGKENLGLDLNREGLGELFGKQFETEIDCCSELQLKYMKNKISKKLEQIHQRETSPPKASPKKQPFSSIKAYLKHRKQQFKLLRESHYQPDQPENNQQFTPKELKRKVFKVRSRKQLTQTTQNLDSTKKRPHDFRMDSSVNIIGRPLADSNLLYQPDNSIFNELELSQYTKRIFDKQGKQEGGLSTNRGELSSILNNADGKGCEVEGRILEEIDRKFELCD